MSKRNLTLALALSLASLAHASASAGEITLFTGQGFQGKELRLNMPVRDLSTMDFNDRTGSMMVRSGRWEVCVHADYRECDVIGPGEYPDLNRLGGQISSLREVGGGVDDGRGDDRRDDYRGGRANGRGGEGVILFDALDMRGRSVPLRSDVPNFQNLGFNDKAQSMVILSGNWEFCLHANFRGECRVYGPGEYRNLERAFYRSISSARMVSDDGGRGRGRDRDRRNRDGVELFSGMGFGGERVQVRAETRNMEHMNFNDRAASLIVYSGQWEFCQHADFRGQCLTYGPGRYDRLGGLTNQISSMRRVR